IRNCMPDCDLLYMDCYLPALDRACFFSSFSGARHCSRLKLSWVNELTVDIDDGFPLNDSNVYKVTNYYFSSIGIGEKAKLAHLDFEFNLDLEQIRWDNLTELALFGIDYS
ncbi:hypothetical protein GGI04_005387, partial [Coemansia thaxteri]